MISLIGKSSLLGPLKRFMKVKKCVRLLVRSINCNLGGYFKANLKFPKEYPMKPPKMKFISKIWHPNVHDNGEVSYYRLYKCSNSQIIYLGLHFYSSRSR